MNGGGGGGAGRDEQVVQSHPRLSLYVRRASMSRSSTCPTSNCPTAIKAARAASMGSAWVAVGCSSRGHVDTKTSARWLRSPT